MQNLTLFTLLFSEDHCINHIKLTLNLSYLWRLPPAHAARYTCPGGGLAITSTSSFPSPYLPPSVNPHSPSPPPARAARSSPRASNLAEQRSPWLRRHEFQEGLLHDQLEDLLLGPSGRGSLRRCRVRGVRSGRKRARASERASEAGSEAGWSLSSVRTVK